MREREVREVREAIDVREVREVREAIEVSDVRGPSEAREVTCSEVGWIEAR